jgi:hypothetical protein
MQLTLAFLELELPHPTPQPLSQQLVDAETRAEALDVLARIIAQAFETTGQTQQTGAADE